MFCYFNCKDAELNLEVRPGVSKNSVYPWVTSAGDARIKLRLNLQMKERKRLGNSELMASYALGGALKSPCSIPATCLALIVCDEAPCKSFTPHATPGGIVKRRNVGLNHLPGSHSQDVIEAEFQLRDIPSRLPLSWHFPHLPPGASSTSTEKSWDDK